MQCKSTYRLRYRAQAYALIELLIEKLEARGKSVIGFRVDTLTVWTLRWITTRRWQLTRKKKNYPFVLVQFLSVTTQYGVNVSNAIIWTWIFIMIKKNMWRRGHQIIFPNRFSPFFFFFRVVYFFIAAETKEYRVAKVGGDCGGPSHSSVYTLYIYIFLYTLINTASRRSN